MEPLTYKLDRSVVIQAAPTIVFRYFTDSQRWANWWGAGSTIEAHPGGKVYIRHPNGIETVGEVLEVIAPEQIVFTYGFASGQPIPPGGSKVTVRLEPAQGGATRLSLTHELASEKVRDEHVQGWRFQLSLFANVVADEVFAAGSGLADAWFDAWAITDEASRRDAFARIAEETAVFHDRYSLLEGITDLTAHSGAAQRFMPGIRLKRKGEVRHCQGVVLADWAATTPDGVERMTGTNVFVLSPNTKIASVTGLHNPAAAVSR